MHHVKKVHFLFDKFFVEGLVHIRVPPRAMHGPASTASLVQKNHIFVHGRWDQVHVLGAVIHLEADHMVVVPNHIHLDICAI